MLIIHKGEYFGKVECDCLMLFQIYVSKTITERTRVCLTCFPTAFDGKTINFLSHFGVVSP